MTDEAASGLRERDRELLAFTVPSSPLPLQRSSPSRPPPNYRLIDRQDRARRARYGVRMARAGLSLLGLSITCAVS